MRLDELVDLLNDFVAERDRSPAVSVLVDELISWAIRTNRVEVR